MSHMRILYREFKIDTPSSWTEVAHPAAKINRGTALYSLELDLPELSADDWVLDLGDVRESARVRINGQEAGIAWAALFRLYAHVHSHARNPGPKPSHPPIIQANPTPMNTMQYPG
jgi:hypothetical protein